MSKRPKLPALPTDRKPATIERYVQGVLAYAKHEFSKGRDDESVLSELRKAGVLSGARWQVREAYLAFLGVTPEMRKRARIVGLLGATGAYLVGVFAPWPTPNLRLLGPLILALLTVSPVDLQYRRSWKRRKPPVL